jgi:hypothetical protein
VTSILPLRNIPLTIDLPNCQLHTRYSRIRTCLPSRTSVGSGRGRGTRFQASSRVACGGRGLAPTQPSPQSAPTGLEPASTASAGAEPVDQRDAWACSVSSSHRTTRHSLNSFYILKAIQPGRHSSHSNFCLKPPTLQSCYSPPTLLRCPQDVAAFFTAVPSTRHRPPLHYCTKLPAIGASAVVPT